MSKLALLFLLVFISGIYAILAIGPVYGFFVYELVYFLNPGERWWSKSLPNLSYSFIIIILTILSFMIRRKDHQNNLIKDIPQAKWFMFLFIVFCIVSFFAANKVIHQQFLFNLFKLYIIMYLAYRIIDSRYKLELALFCYIVGVAYIGYEAFTVGRNGYGRVEGIGTADAPGANGTAATMVPAIPLLIYFFWQSQWRKKIVIAVLGLFIVNGIVLISSRGAFLGATVGSGYFLSYMLFSKFKLPKQRLMLMLILIIGIGAVLRLADTAFLDRMETIQTSSSKESEVSGGRRINFWLATFDLLEDHPFGAGIYGYQTLSPIYLHDESFFTTVGGMRVRAVHSLWFQALSEVGWLGFIIFLLLLKSIFQQNKMARIRLRAQKDYKNYYLLIAIEGGLLGFLTTGTFIDAFRSEILYWFMLFCICASTITLRNLQENESKVVRRFR